MDMAFLNEEQYFGMMTSKQAEEVKKLQDEGWAFFAFTTNKSAIMVKDSLVKRVTRK